jgi:outer membrane protein
MLRFIVIISILILGTNCYSTNLDDAINKAIKHSAVLKSQLYHYRASKQHYKANMLATFLPKTTISYSVDELLDNGLDSTKSNFIMTKRLLNDSSFELGKSSYLVKAEEIIFHQLKQKVALNAVKAYVDVLQSTEMLKLREHKEHVASENLSTMRKRFSLSEVTDTEVSLAKAKYSSSISERVDAEGKLELAKVTYYHLIGEEANNLAKIRNYLLPNGSGLSECVQLAKNNNLNLKEIIYKRKAARAGISSARSKFLPYLEIYLSSMVHHGKINSQSDVFKNLTKNLKVGFTVTVPIFNGGIDVVGINAAKMGFKKLTYDYHEAVKEVEKKVIHAWNTMLTAQAMMEASREAEKAAMLALAGVEKEVELNLKSTTDLLDTEDALFKARSDLVVAKSNYVISIYNLLFVTNSVDI